jgi:hypothetical protein
MAKWLNSIVAQLEIDKMKRSLTYWVRIKKKDFVGGGTFQCMVGSHGGIMSGTRSRVCADVSSIAGGYGNLIATGADCSFIGGGRGNTVSGAYSAILGGYNNNDNGFNFVGIFGQNINNPANMAPNTFHVNCLNAINTPLFTLGPFVPGTIYYVPVGTPPPVGACALYIQ